MYHKTEKRGIKREIKQEVIEEEVQEEAEIQKRIKKEIKKEIIEEVQEQTRSPAKEEEEEVQIIEEEEEEEQVQIIEEEEEEVQIIEEEEQQREVLSVEVEEEPSRESNETWMRVALAFAQAGLERGEVPVGCLFIYRNQIIASGMNTVNETKNATRHAEMNCIDVALNYAASKDISYEQIFQELKVVVTVEPCIMCAAAMIDLQIPQIIYGCKNNRFGGCESVFDIKRMFKNSNCVIQGGICAEESIQLLKTFYKGENPNAPKNKAKKKQS